MSIPLPESAVQSISVIIGKDALDSLRSPESSDFGDRLPGRESIATTVSELDDISLDDEPPSSSAPSDPLKSKAISASLQESLPSVLESLSLAGKDEAQEEKSVNDQGGLTHGTNSDASHHGPSHQKSASLTTIRSGRTLSLIDEKRRSTRLSLHGQQALQEEFSRLQKEKQLLQQQGIEETIDWGGSLQLELSRQLTAA
jgi:aarF domain-containing kinase